MEDYLSAYTGQEIDAAVASVAGKVDKEEGKGLSSNDFTDDLKAKLEGIDLSTKQDVLVSGESIKTINGESLLGDGNIEVSGGTGTVDPALNEHSPNPVQNAAIFAALEGKVDKSAYEEKLEDLVSKTDIVTQGIVVPRAEINGIQFYKNADGSFTVGAETIKNSEGDSMATKEEILSEVDKIIDNAPENMRTLRQISDELKDSESAVAAILTAIETKAGKDTLARVATTGDYKDLGNKPNIPTAQTPVSYFKDDGKYMKTSDPVFLTLASKEYVNDRIGSAFKYRGTVDTFDELPTGAGVQNGDFYIVKEAHDEHPENSSYIWQGEGWEFFMNGAAEAKTSIIHVDELPLTDIEYDKIYQVSTEGDKVDVYFTLNGQISKNERRWEGEEDKAIAQIINVPNGDWGKVEKMPIFTEVYDDELETKNLYLTAYDVDGEYYYLPATVTGNYDEEPEPEDIEFLAPVKLNDGDTIPAGLVINLNDDFFNYFREDEESTMLEFYLDHEGTGQVPFATITADVYDEESGETQHIEAHYTFDWDKWKADPDDEEVITCDVEEAADILTYDEGGKWGNMSYIGCYFRAYYLPMEVSATVEMAEGWTQIYKGMEEMVQWNGNIESTAEIINGVQVPVGTEFHADGKDDDMEGLHIAVDTPNHTKLFHQTIYGDDDETVIAEKDVYSYTLGTVHSEPEEEDMQPIEMPIYTVAYDYLGTEPQNLNEILFIDSSKVEFVPMEPEIEAYGDDVDEGDHDDDWSNVERSTVPVINVSGKDYYLFTNGEMYAALDDEMERCPNLEFMASTDTGRIVFECDELDDIKIPISMAENDEPIMDVTDSYGPYNIGYTNEEGEWTYKEFPHLVYMKKRDYEDSYYLYGKRPIDLDVHGEPTGYDEEGWSYDYRYCDDEYVTFGYISDSYNITDPRILKGVKAYTNVPECVIISRNIIFESDDEKEGYEFAEITPGRKAFDFEADDLRPHGEDGRLSTWVTLYDEIYFIDTETISVWTRPMHITRNDMYFYSQGEWSKVMSTDDLKDASKDFITPDSIGKFLKLNNFVYVDSDQSLPYGDEADANKWYIKDNNYYHWNKRSWQWDSFVDIVQIPDSYGSAESYISQHGGDIKKLYIGQVLTMNQNQDKDQHVKAYGCYGSSRFDSDLVGRTGGYMHPCRLHFATLSPYSGYPDVENKDVAWMPYDINSVGVYELYVIALHPNDYVNYESYESVNEAFALYYSTSPDKWSFRRVQVGESILSYDGPKFLGFIPDTGNEPTDYIQLEDGGFYVKMRWNAFDRKKVMYQYVNNTLAEIATTDTNAKPVEIIYALPNALEASKDKLYILNKDKSALYHGSTFDGYAVQNAIISHANNEFSPRHGSHPWESASFRYFDHNFMDDRGACIAYPGHDNSWHLDDWDGGKHFNLEYFSRFNDGGTYFDCTEVCLSMDSDTHDLSFNQATPIWGRDYPKRWFMEYNHFPLLLNHDWLEEFNNLVPVFNGEADNGFFIGTFRVQGAPSDESWDMYLSKENDDVYELFVEDDEQVPYRQYRIDFVKTDGNQTMLGSQFERSTYKRWGAYAFDFNDFVHDGHVYGEISCAENAQGLIWVINSKKYSKTSTDEQNPQIYYHYGRGVYPFKNFSELYADAYIQNGSKVLTIGGVDFYYHFVPDPSYRQSGSNVQNMWHVIAATQNVDELYNGDLFDYGVCLWMVSCYCYDGYIGNFLERFRGASYPSVFDGTSEEGEHAYWYGYNQSMIYHPENVGINWDDPDLTIEFHQRKFIRSYVENCGNVVDENLLDKYTGISNDEFFSHITKLYTNVISQQISAICLVRDNKWDIMNLAGLQSKLTTDETLRLTDGGQMSINTNIIAKREEVFSMELYNHSLFMRAFTPNHESTLDIYLSIQSHRSISYDTYSIGDVVSLMRDRMVRVAYPNGTQKVCFIIEARDNFIKFWNEQSGEETSVSLYYDNFDAFNDVVTKLS